MKWIIALCLCLLTVAAPAQTQAPLNSKEQVKDFTGKFLQTLATQNATNAFAMLKAANPESEADIDETLNKTIGLLDQLSATYGRPIGYDIITERALGDTVIKYETLLKLEKFPIRCTIMYYKPHDSWLPARISFDPDLALMFDELFNNGGTNAKRSTPDQP